METTAHTELACFINAVRVPRGFQEKRGDQESIPADLDRPAVERVTIASLHVMKGAAPYVQASKGTANGRAVQLANLKTYMKASRCSSKAFSSAQKQ